MKGQGFTVMRFDNHQVIDGPDYVFTTIEAHIMPFLERPLT
jgi:very-short-patch-repair endonuclease